MKPTIIVAVAALAASLLMSTSAVAPAAAECRPNTSASASVPIAAGGRERACRHARRRWVSLVKRTYGARFTMWSAARNRLHAIFVTFQRHLCTPGRQRPYALT